MHRSSIFALCAVAAAYNTVMAQGVGYDDTPQLPDQPWRVHDINRPNPPIIEAGEAGEPVGAPSDATVLLGEGTGLDAWQHADGKSADWMVKDDGSVQVKAGTGDIETREHFRDFQLHVEFATPDKPVGESQGRGNSGVFLLGAFEIQVLDSFNNKTYADGQCGAMYGQYPPAVNVCRAPGAWQTYDIIFEAPRFDEDGNLEKPAFVTVLQNGVMIHDHEAFQGGTVHRALPHYSPDMAAGPIRLQDHGNPMRFRNIWIRKLDKD